MRVGHMIAMLVKFLSLVVLCIYRCGAQAPPPATPPEETLAKFTLNGTIPLHHYYVDDSNKGRGTHYKYSHEDITVLIEEAEQFINKALSLPLPSAPPSLPHSSTWLTQLTDVWLIHALTKYPIAEGNVIVFGSTSPWYESILLSLGVHHVTVVDYNQLTYHHPSITTKVVGEINHTHFDVAVSLSSFDHDGLGRYGDPINPDGDLVAMETVKGVLKEGGLLFLTVPIGPDVVVWNLHRRYGNIRLPLLLCGWEEVERVGWSETLVEEEAPYTLVYEPVFVLRKNSGIECQ